MAGWLKRLRDRLLRADTGNDFIDACCHRIGGVLRAGPPTSRDHGGEHR
jgi:hypothetical protein